MSTIKNGPISLYCHFNKIIKGPASSFQSPALSRKYVRIVCHTVHCYLTKFHFDSTSDSKESIKVYLPLWSNAYDDVTDFEIWISQKLKNTDISRINIFSSNQKIQLHIKGSFIAKNNFIAEATLKVTSATKAQERN